MVTIGERKVNQKKKSTGYDLEGRKRSGVFLALRWGFPVKHKVVQITQIFGDHDLFLSPTGDHFVTFSAGGVRPDGADGTVRITLASLPAIGSATGREGARGGGQKCDVIRLSGTHYRVLAIHPGGRSRKERRNGKDRKSHKRVIE